MVVAGIEGVLSRNYWPIFCRVDCDEAFDSKDLLAANLRNQLEEKT